MALTTRFALTHFGAGANGDLGDAGGKYTGRDRRVLDRILAALESHTHAGGDRLTDPEFAPTLALFETGGALASGTTYYYRIGFVDQFNLETAATPEVSVTTPGAVGVPAPPNLTAVADVNGVAGTLDEGMHEYAFTVHAGGNETQMSASQVILLTDWRVVEIRALDGFPVGAEEVSIWRQGPFDSDFTRLATVPVPAPSTDPVFVDDGSIASDPCPCDPEKLPPLENLTNATNRVAITIPAASVAAGSGVVGWRIYRSTESGNYSPSSLVGEVFEPIVDGGDDLSYTFEDLGIDGLMPGMPNERSQTMIPSRLVGGAGGGGGTGQVFLTAPAVSGVHAVWRLIASHDGVLETRDTGLTVGEALPTLILTDEVGVPWLVEVDAAGALTTVVEDPAAPLEGAWRHDYNDGPHIPTSDVLLTWRLGVDAVGVLFTEGDEVGGADMLRLLPRVTEPAIPDAGGVLYVIDGALCWKDSNGVTTVLSPATEPVYE